jgi:hypothetical protein
VICHIAFNAAMRLRCCRAGGWAISAIKSHFATDDPIKFLYPQFEKCVMDVITHNLRQRTCCEIDGVLISGFQEIRRLGDGKLIQRSSRCAGASCLSKALLCLLATVESCQTRSPTRISFALEREFTGRVDTRAVLMKLGGGSGGSVPTCAISWPSQIVNL